MLDLAGLNSTIVTALDPGVTIPLRGLTTITLPSWLAGQLVDDFGEVMAYPRIDLPMYEPLKAISIELFLPNINLIAPNSITLVETNQRFIEAYMVGLNHEFARKLLWREYPTDQRGSYFRQFWDVRSVINSEGLSENALREQLYDIPELHRWALTSALGDHNNRQSPTEHGEQAVLVIRGELLKKYPTAVIYANRADWEYESDGHTPDLTKPRKLVPLAAGRGGQAAARQGADAAVRGEGRSRHLLLRLRSDHPGGEGRVRSSARHGSGLVLRDQGASGRAPVRPRAHARREPRGARRAHLGRRAARRARPASSCRPGTSTRSR